MIAAGIEDKSGATEKVETEARFGMFIPGGTGLEEASLGEDATDRGGVGPAGP